MNNDSIATGIRFGATAKPEHAREAVAAAMEKAKLSNAASVILFLTNGYAQQPQAAITAAAKQASTLQVYGCTAAGLFSEQEWLLDVEGAVAMVFPNECALEPASVLASREQLTRNMPLFCLTSPQSSNIAINQWDQGMIGAISSNEYGQGDFPIWQASRLSKTGFIHAGFAADLQCDIAVSQGIRRLSKNQIISTSYNNCIQSVDGLPAAQSLQKALPENVYDMFLEQPYHTLCAQSESASGEGLNNGFFKLNNVVAIDQEEQSIYLSGSAKKGRHIFWALRDRSLAKQEMKHNLQSLQKSIKAPKFALIFSSISRGPYFYGEQDCDLQLFQQHFPEVPLIGIYSTGEISPGSHYAALSRRYSSVIAVYS